MSSDKYSTLTQTSIQTPPPPTTLPLQMPSTHKQVTQNTRHWTTVVANQPSWNVLHPLVQAKLMVPLIETQGPSPNHSSHISARTQPHLLENTKKGPGLYTGAQAFGSQARTIFCI